MRYVMGVLLVLGAMACGSPSPTAGVEASALPVTSDVVAQAAPAPEPQAAPDHATHLKVGIVYSANQMGELEPCG